MVSVLVMITLPLASFYVTWLVVRSRIAAPFVEKWQYRWEERWINHETTDQSEREQLWEGEWNSKLAYLPTCAWCTGYWVTLTLIIVTMPSTDVPIWPVWPLYLLATTAFVGIMDFLTHREA
jgi:uncharacterized protein DUF1360